MEIMTETELRQLLEDNGCSLRTLPRRGKRRDAVYLQARSKQAPYPIVHITSRRQLPILTREEVLEKIGRIGAAS